MTDGLEWWEPRAPLEGSRGIPTLYDEEDPMVRAAIAFYAGAARRVLGVAPGAAGNTRVARGDVALETT